MSEIMNEMNTDKGLATCATVMNDMFLSTAGNRGSTDDMPGKAIMAMLDFTDMNELSSLIGKDILKRVKYVCDSWSKKYTEEEVKDFIKSYISSNRYAISLYLDSSIKEPYSSMYYLVRRLNEGIGNALYGWGYDFGCDSKVEAYVRKYMALALI